jgi:hypothetical protein
MTRVCDDRAVRVDEPVAVPNEALAAKVGEWTLVDPGPFRVDGKKQQHLMAECKCEGRRYFTRAAWVRGRNEKACGKQEMSQCCDNCFAARRKTNISVRSEPAAILPHYKMKGG